MTETAALAETARQKRAAAMRAVELVEPGMVLGLGSGSTAELALEALAVRVGAGLRGAGGMPFVTDGGNSLADCVFPAIVDPAALERQLSAMIGIVESGLFIGLASTVIVGRPSGVEILE